MTIFIAAVITALALGAAAGGVFFYAQEPVYELADERESVRIGDPGHNLVGPNWTGNVPERSETEGTSETGRHSPGNRSALFRPEA